MTPKNRNWKKNSKTSIPDKRQMKSLSGYPPHRMKPNFVLFSHCVTRISSLLYTNILTLPKARRILCALILLNQGNNDIAAFLGISYESVLKARYRLRKKLNLKKDAVLDHIIKEISEESPKRFNKLIAG